MTRHWYVVANLHSSFRNVLSPILNMFIHSINTFIGCNIPWRMRQCSLLWTPALVSFLCVFYTVTCPYSPLQEHVHAYQWNVFVISYPVCCVGKVNWGQLETCNVSGLLNYLLMHASRALVHRSIIVIIYERSKPTNRPIFHFSLYIRRCHTYRNVLRDSKSKTKFWFTKFKFYYS